MCEPSLPTPAWLAGRGGRPAGHCMRDIVDAIRYLTHNGPVWRALPADFPPAWTVYWWAAKWEADGSTARMHDDLRGQVRAAAGRTQQPTAAIIDSQSVKGSEMVARRDRGYDAGKKINDQAPPGRGHGRLTADRPRLRAAGRPPRNLRLGHDRMTRRLARAASGTSSAIAVPCRAPAQDPVSCQCRCPWEDRAGRTGKCPLVRAYAGEAGWSSRRLWLRCSTARCLALHRRLVSGRWCRRRGCCRFAGR